MVGWVWLGPDTHSIIWQIAKMQMKANKQVDKMLLPAAFHMTAEPYVSVTVYVCVFALYALVTVICCK